MLETLSVESVADAVDRRRSHPCRPVRASTHGRLAEERTLAMARGYAASGGIAGCDEVLGLLRSCCDQPLSLLARWIVARDVVSFEWRSTTMLPIFQFDLADMTVRSPVRQVLQELRAAFDDEEVALWFAQPNAWLDDRAPVEVLRTDPALVLATARADCYIARG